MLKEFFDGKTLNKSVNPDEAVAYGAAVQAAILSNQAFGEMSDITLLDVTPLSIGREIVGGLMVVAIPKNTNIPYQITQIAVTVADN